MGKEDRDWFPEESRRIEKNLRRGLGEVLDPKDAREAQKEEARLQKMLDKHLKSEETRASGLKSEKKRTSKQKSEETRTSGQKKSSLLTISILCILAAVAVGVYLWATGS